MQRDHLQAVTTFVCCFPRAWIAAFVSRQKINSGLALREFGSRYCFQSPNFDSQGYAANNWPMKSELQKNFARTTHFDFFGNNNL